MENENEEVITSQNDDNENVDSEINEQDENLDATRKLDELSEKNKQLFERAKKAEGELKEFKSKIPEKPKLDNSQSNEPDYAKLAFLETKGVNHPDDQKIVQDEANRLKLPLTDILGMAHIKSKLDTNKVQREAQAGMPKGKGSSGTGSQQDVDYWLAKGETPDDQELAEKVIEARIKKEVSSNKFSDVLFTG